MILSVLSAILCLTVSAAPGDPTVKWSTAVKTIDQTHYEVVFTGVTQEDFHTYPLTDALSPTIIEFDENQDVVLDGAPVESYEPGEYKGETVIFGKYVITQKVIAENSAKLTGNINWRSCSGDNCFSPEDYEFKAMVGPAPAAEQTVEAAPAAKASSTPSSLWALILEAILWGFAMLLTPCVFPMVPMTVSFFVKGSSNPAAGRFKAIMYGVFIVLLYTVPISAIIGITWIAGGSAVTADIFNWLATHWLPNLLFFAIFMVFAMSFFGAFEITMPASLVNKTDKESDRKGLLGVFFMALTLVLVSFSCTGPIVGTVLIKSTQGEFWTPMVTMLAFSVAFALPFMLLALFPSLLKNLPKSGGWLNSVKVVLGFIEIALGFKFLSTADQTYHWGILDREIYLAIWIVCFTMLGFYLLGKIRFKHDSPSEHVSVLRLALSIAVFTFVVYMIPGMWGAPLKALSGYLPPMETQDFVMGSYAPAAAQPATMQISAPAGVAQPDLELPHGLKGYSSLEQGSAAAAALGRNVFVDITGHGCVNCREMEARVWSDPEVLRILRDEYVIVALYTDDKAKLPESEWVTTPSGKVLKDVGRVNSNLVQTRFGVNAQPNYVLLTPDGTQLAPVRGYNLSIDEYVAFLNKGI